MKQEKTGPLFIVGGADNARDIYEHFVRACSSKNEKPTLGIISTASELPRESYEKISKRLSSAGAGEIIHLPLSSLDESLKGKENDPEVARTISGCQGIWFTGGDQSRTYTCLVPEGKKSLCLQALWTLYEQGGALGGTSAGAAIMSDPMMYGGTSLGCFGGIPGQEELQIGPGLGFYPDGLVDQHFDARGRLVRLCTALKKTGHTIGFGVSEDTAMIVNGPKIQVAGKGGVYIVRVLDEGPYPYELSYIEPGDEYNRDTDLCSFPQKNETWGDESLDTHRPVASGVLSPHGTLRDFLGRELLDNDFDNLWKQGDLGYVRSFLVGDGGTGKPEQPMPGFELRFYNNIKTSRGYYSSEGSISFQKVGFSFHPVTLTPNNP